MIDIIIPVYNAQKVLPTTLMSIYLQKVSVPFQVTLVDDCSEDSYDEIINRFQEFFPIQVIRLKQNAGAGVAREKGMESTNGDYIVFIDSDDYFYNSDSLEALYQEIIKGYDLVYGNEYDEKKDLFVYNDGNLHGKIYRRSFLKDHDVHFNETRFHEDNYFNHFVLFSGAKKIFIEDKTYFYCNNESSITNIQPDKEFERTEILLSNMRELMNRFPLCDENRDTYKRFVFIKFLHFHNMSRDLDDEKKEQLRKWILEYIPETISLYGIYDKTKLILAIEKLYKKK